MCLCVCCVGDGIHGVLTVPAAAAAAAADSITDDAVNDANYDADSDADADKPIFRPAPRNITVSPGDRASLKCRVDNLGTKTVTLIS